MKKKILFLVQIPPPIHGASLINLSLVESKYLNKRYDIKVVPITFSDTISDIGKLSLKKVYKTFKLGIGFVYQIIKFRPAFVYFTIAPIGSAFYRDLLYVSIIKFFNLKHIFHLHGLGIHNATASKSFTRRVYQWVFKKSNVICISNSHLNDLRNVNCKKKYVINNGINLSSYSCRIKYTGNNEKKRILFLSNYVISKGVLIFVETLSILKNVDPRFEAIMIGADGDYTKQQLEKYIHEKGLTEWINVKESVSDDLIKFQYFNWADIFFFPTYNDLFPTVILEAMQSSCAILTTNIGGIPEMIENYTDGIIELDHKPEKFAIILKHLFENPQEISRLGTQARQKFERRFTKQVFEENINIIFQEI